MEGDPLTRGPVQGNRMNGAAFLLSAVCSTCIFRAPRSCVKPLSFFFSAMSCFRRHRQDGVSAQPIHHFEPRTCAFTYTEASTISSSQTPHWRPERDRMTP